MDPAPYLDWLKRELFEQAPVNIAVIDRDFHVVHANRNFIELFGEIRGRKCYEVYKKRDAPCERCLTSKTFADGKVRVNEEVGIDREGRQAHYMVHVVPITREDGSIPWIVEMSTDITETHRLKTEYMTLFEQVPCYVTVLNREYRVVRANERFREKFGEPSGQHCYEIFKRRTEPCESCPSRETFADGKIHTSEHSGVAKDGTPTRYVVTTAPASRGKDGFSHVIEMAVDVTKLRAVEEKLRRENALRAALVTHSIDAIIGTGPTGKVLLFNPAAERLLGLSAGEVIGRSLPAGRLPPEFERIRAAREGHVVLDAAEVTHAGGRKIPVRFSAHALRRGGDFLGTAAFIQDLTEVRQLEKEKIDAERLAAVGQTVAGLAHGIKNILTGLEGGMYFLNSGLKKGKTERIDEGFGMLTRNMEKISTLVRNLLSFSKGRVPKVTLVDPEAFLDEMVELYREAAAREGVLLSKEVPAPLEPAPFDRGSIHTALANLVANAIDACQMGGRRPCRVVVRAREREGAVVFEVEDEGCGMDQEVRSLAFTNFFTTKGAGGTGLGLLLTRKITQEHGGRITFESTPSEGSVFRLVFPRDRLPAPGDTEEEGGGS